MVPEARTRRSTAGDGEGSAGKTSLATEFARELENDAGTLAAAQTCWRACCDARSGTGTSGRCHRPLLVLALAADLEHLAIPALSVAVETNSVSARLIADTITAQALPTQAPGRTAAAIPRHSLDSRRPPQLFSAAGEAGTAPRRTPGAVPAHSCRTLTNPAFARMP